MLGLLWSVLLQFDPLGTTAAADAQSEALFIRLFGSSYESAAQDAITVVLIDDAYLSEVGSAWPLSYPQQELLLEEIASYAPQAVFLDILHLHHHGNTDDRVERGLEQLLERVKTMGEGNGSHDATPLFVPKLVRELPESVGCAGADLPPSLRSLSLVTEAAVTPRLVKSGARQTFIGWSGCRDRYPPWVFDDPLRPTPAFALYRHACLHGTRTFPGCSAIQGAADPVSLAAAFEVPMMVRWGSGPSADSVEGYVAAGLSDCARPPVWKQILAMVPQTLGGADGRGMRALCPYTDTVHATWLLGNRTANRDWLERMLRGRIVLIGTRLDGLQDRVVSPVDGQIPGVYLIAMALDNYLEYGDKYFRDPSRWVGWLAVLGALGLIWAIGRDSERYLRNRPGQDGSPGRCLAQLCACKLLYPLVASLMITLFMWWYGIAPINWIAAVFIVFVANPVRAGDYFGILRSNRDDD